MNSFALKLFDDKFRNENVKLIAGVDEAGRGPLAGPVVAASVIFDSDVYIEGINDSKKLSEKERTRLFNIITEKSLSFSYSIIQPDEIDKINILQASLLAMKQSINKLQIQPDLILIDGNKSFEHSIKSKTIVKGDAKSFSIAAASIIAKVIRDEIMINLSNNFPIYNWSKNKGYPTKEHIQTIRKYGYTPIHRKTFLKKILTQEQLSQRLTNKFL